MVLAMSAWYAEESYPLSGTQTGMSWLDGTNNWGKIVKAGPCAESTTDTGNHYATFSDIRIGDIGTTTAPPAPPTPPSPPSPPTPPAPPAGTCNGCGYSCDASWWCWWRWLHVVRHMPDQLQRRTQCSLVRWIYSNTPNATHANTTSASNATSTSTAHTSISKWLPRRHFVSMHRVMPKQPSSCLQSMCKRLRGKMHLSCLCLIATFRNVMKC